MAFTNKAAFLNQQDNGDFEVKDASQYKPGPGEVLLKNHAMAINPMDWKIQDYGSQLPLGLKYPVILGADVAGEIYELGEGVTEFKKGDRVAGMANWFLTHEPKDGAFQEYTICTANAISLLPDELPYKSGVVLPLALATSAMALYPSDRFGLPLPQPENPKSISKVLLVWGGSSSTGSAAIQLAAASGVTVIATASSKNHDFVKKLGAAEVLDYRDDNTVDNLIKAIKNTKGEFIGALDSIGEDSTWRTCAEIVKGLGGGTVISNLPMAYENVPETVTVLPVNNTAEIIKHKDIVEGIYKHYVPAALKAGTLKAVPEPVVAGQGLEKVGDAVAMLRKGISYGKVVVEL